MKQQLINTITDAKVAGAVAGSTTITSLFDLIQGGVSIFAVAAGAILSLTLITIHLLRWRSDKRDANVRLEMDMEANKKLQERLTLENKVLSLELKTLKDK